MASLHVAKSSGAGPSARGRAELGGGIGSSAERDSSFSWARVGPWHLSARPTHSLKLGTRVWPGTTRLGGTDGEIHRLHPRDPCWSASRPKRSAFTTFLREEIGVELQERG